MIESKLYMYESKCLTSIGAQHASRHDWQKDCFVEDDD